MTSILLERLMTSPAGPIKLVSTDAALVSVLWSRSPDPANLRRGHPVLDLAERQLSEYFAGERRHFELPLALEGTEFQRAVWNELLKIPYGTTCSYAMVARRLARPKAVRAVGLANRENPIAIVVPCHRVIGADGSLTGYAGGLDAKQWLIAHEQRAGGLGQMSLV